MLGEGARYCECPMVLLLALDVAAIGGKPATTALG